MINCAVIGLGYWGPNIIRNLIENDTTNVKYVVDLSPARLAFIATKYPAIIATADYDQVLKDPDVDAVFVITPVATHYQLSKQALLAGKHVFVEKPMVSRYKDGVELVEIAEQSGLVLAVDHTFVFTGAVQKINELIVNKSLGDLMFYDSTRVNLGLFQQDVNVLWDLAPHDLSILDFLVGKMPKSVSAVGKAFYGQLPSMAYVTLDYGDFMIAHLNLSWMSPVKLRTILIGGSSRMVVYDDINPDEKVKVYDKGVVVDKSEPELLRNQLISYRTGDMYSPNLNPVEALKVEIQHFASCIERGFGSINDGRAGLRVVSVLEAAQKSLQNGGDRVLL